MRVSILNADERVKPEMTASVTFQEIRATATRSQPEANPAPIVLIPKRTVRGQSGASVVWVVTNGTATRRPVTLGRERLDQMEVRSGVVPGEALILNPPDGLTDRGPVRVKAK